MNKCPEHGKYTCHDCEWPPLKPLFETGEL